MNRYNFDEVISREGTWSSKWSNENIIPLSIADMDFKTSPKIIDALEKRIKHGIYGYTDVSDDFKKAIINWYKRRHDFKIDSDWILFSTGVIPSLSSLVRWFSKPNDNIVTITPVYDIFFHSIENNKRIVKECPLTYKDYKYSLDFDLFDNLLSQPNTPLLILCNPHNPTGIVWSKEDLIKIGQIARKHNVLVISDEIHGDLVRKDIKYIPYMSACEDNKINSIMLSSCTKTFNLAGIQTSYIVCPDKNLFKGVYRSINNDEIAEPNILSQIALISAYNDSEDWLEELRSYLDSNIEFATNYLKDNIPNISVIKSLGTYLMWVDVSNITSDSYKLTDYLLKEYKVLVNPGSEYRGNGNTFIRINIACPKATLKEGLNRLAKGMKSYKE